MASEILPGNLRVNVIKYHTVLFDAVYILFHFNVFPSPVMQFFLTLVTVCSIYAVDQSCHYSQTVSPLYIAKYKYIYRLYLLPTHARLLDFWSIRSIAAICSIIITNFHYFSLLAYYIAFIFVKTIFQSHDWFSSQFLRPHIHQTVILCSFQFHYPASYNVNVFLRGLLSVPYQKFSRVSVFLLPFYFDNILPLPLLTFQWPFAM